MVLIFFLPNLVVNPVQVQPDESHRVSYVLCFRMWSNFELFLNAKYHLFLGTNFPPTHTHCLFSSRGRCPHEITLMILSRTFHSPWLFQVHKLIHLWPLWQWILLQEILELQQPMFQLGGYSRSGYFLLAHTIPVWAGVENSLHTAGTLVTRDGKLLLK